MSRRHLLTLAALALATGGCATTAGSRNPADPWEGFNRGVYQFNDTLDRALLKPVAQGYDFILPDLAKAGVRNFFSNLREPLTIVNELLQGKGERALDGTGRFLINSSFGLLGIFDIASAAGLARREEDFGQTLGRWGVPPGPFLMLPFFGPSTVRDGLARPVDALAQYVYWVEHVPTRNTAYAVDVISTRASLLAAGRVLEEAAFDPYAFVRDAYLQRRQRLVYDGNPPQTEDEKLEEEETNK